jgi:hypothetical protein
VDIPLKDMTWNLKEDANIGTKIGDVKYPIVLDQFGGGLFTIFYDPGIRSWGEA